MSQALDQSTSASSPPSLSGAAPPSDEPFPTRPPSRRDIPDPLPTTRTPARVNRVAEASELLVAHIQSRYGTEETEAWLPPERELAERLGCSRPVIREATKRLEIQGLLESHHGKGHKVVNQLQRPMNRSFELLVPEIDERLRQLAEARVLVEPEIAAQAALRREDHHLARLATCQAKLLGAESFPDACDADTLFHYELALAAGNTVFALFLRSLSDLGRESRLRTYSQVGSGKAHTHHAAILAAVIDGDAERARAMMLKHVVQAQEDLPISEPEPNASPRSESSSSAD